MVKTKEKIDLAKLSEEELMNLRVCDLPLSIEGSWLKSCVEELYNNLESKGINFKPECYLADEWLTPDKEPVVGIAFFLSDPTLMKLERKMILEVEGGTRSWCMKLLRHEAGHALNYAYKFYRRKKWKSVFGEFSKEYEDTYRFRPYSKSFVRHLEDYYAQYHPDEDFAETFSVWLTPGLNWEKQYRGWKAIDKLKYVDELMQEIKIKPPMVSKGKKYWQASQIKATLNNFYKKKRRSYAEEFPDFHDSNLKRIFSPLEEKSLSDKDKGKNLAADILKRRKKDILNNIAKWTGEKKYTISDLLDNIIRRSKALSLGSEKDEALVMLEISAYVTTLVMNYLHTGWFSKGK